MNGDKADHDLENIRLEFIGNCKASYLSASLAPLVECSATVVGGWGLPIHDGKPAIPLETNFGWAQWFVDRMAAEMPDFASKRADHRISDSKVALLSFPGVFTYGHWIIDIAARLTTLSRHFDLSKLLYIVPDPFFAWAKPFLDAYAIADKQLIKLGGADMVFCENLIIPTLLRVNDYLPDEPHRSSLRTLNQYAAVFEDGTRGCEKLFVKHVPQTSKGSRASLQNSDELERILSSLGFVTIVPASMPIDEQIRSFRQARLVVGEDSSALHNCVWSRQRTTTVVLSSPHRHNILHEGISRLLDQQCVFIYGKLHDNEFFVVPEAKICAKLERLGSALEGL